jgi:hypothetical protein
MDELLNFLKENGVIITVENGIITIEAEEINLAGDVYINGAPV